jgi:hypothetical protein
LAFHSGREADYSPTSGTGVEEWVELYLHSPNAPSWRGAQLGGAQGQFYLFTFYSDHRRTELFASLEAQSLFDSTEEY